MIQLEEFNAGHIEMGTGGYRYFVPSFVNDQWIWESPEINSLLESAAVQLGQLNSFARLVPNIDLFIQLHVTKEAVISSRIEGTQTNIDEALMPEEEIKEERKNDWKEVRNYVTALNHAIDKLSELPLSSRLIKTTHGHLMDSVRGQEKQPGAFRQSQNWIGGTSLKDAVFIPPHHQYIGKLMSDLENFLHNEGIEVPDLIKIAIAHYQFETIHPFLDGNGRIGRLLITLYLVNRHILDKPLLYLSSYFEKDKSLYYDNLTFVRTRNDMKQWIKYFLAGIEQTAADAASVLQNVLLLKERVETNIRNNFGRKTQSAYTLQQALFNLPIVQVNDVARICQLSKKAAYDLVRDFEKAGILKEITGFARNKAYAFSEYLDLYRKGDKTQ